MQDHQVCLGLLEMFHCKERRSLFLRLCFPTAATLSSSDHLQVVFDNSKVGAFLEECSQQFESILDAEDGRDGVAIEKVLEDMQSCEGAPIVQHLVEELFQKPRKEKAAK